MQDSPDSYDDLKQRVEELEQILLSLLFRLEQETQNGLPGAYVDDLAKRLAEAVDKRTTNTASENDSRTESVNDPVNGPR